MPTITTAQTGDYNIGGTWVGGVVPGDGDTIIIANGHTLTVPAGYTAVVGTDDGSNVAIKCSTTAGTGVLVVNGTLQFKGHVQQANATWTINAGGVLEHVSAASNYQWQIGMIASQANAILKLTGTGPLTSRVNVRNGAGSARFKGFFGGATGLVGTQTVTGGLAGSGRIEAKWTTFTELGVAPAQWLDAKLGGGFRLTFEDCLVVGCTGAVIHNTLAATDHFIFDRSSILSPAQAGNLASLLIWSNSTRTTGTRRIQDAVIEGGLQQTYFLGFTMQRVSLVSQDGSSQTPFFENSGVQPAMLDLFEDVFVYSRSAVSTTCTLVQGTTMSRLEFALTLAEIFDNLSLDDLGLGEEDVVGGAQFIHAVHLVGDVF